MKVLHIMILSAELEEEKAKALFSKQWGNADVTRANILHQGLTAKQLKLQFSNLVNAHLERINNEE